MGLLLDAHRLNGGLVDGEDLLSRPGTVVPTFRLDDLVDTPVGLLKIDVEGAEARVVGGARKLIERHRPVVTTELSEAMLDAVSGMTPTEYLDYFHSLGYSLAVIDRAGGSPRRYRPYVPSFPTGGSTSRSKTFCSPLTTRRSTCRAFGAPEVQLKCVSLTVQLASQRVRQ